MPGPRYRLLIVREDLAADRDLDVLGARVAVDGNRVTPVMSISMQDCRRSDLLAPAEQDLEAVRRLISESAHSLPRSPTGHATEED